MKLSLEILNTKPNVNENDLKMKLTQNQSEEMMTVLQRVL